jgi:biotin synthase
LHRNPFIEENPENIRVSVGSAIVLGLMHGKLDTLPTTLYMLTYHDSKCTANCGFCPQARKSKSRADMLSRVTWPIFQTSQVIQKLKNLNNKKVKRICIQALNYQTVFEDILNLIREIRVAVDLPISVSCQPFREEEMKKLADASVDRIGIPLDAATEDIFDRVKGNLAEGPYTWARQQENLKKAVEIFGRGKVSTHLIVGLGETEKDMANMIQWCVDNGIFPGLFSFTPVIGTALESGSQPSLDHYRRMQIARYLVANGKARYEKMVFNDYGCLIDFGVIKEELLQTIRSGKPFLTSGCPDCNRPYYNERPGGPLYNYPQMPLSNEIDEIEKQILKCKEEQ